MESHLNSKRPPISYDQLIQSMGSDMAKVPDHRASNTVHKLKDVLMSALALFTLKYPSLLCFEQQCDLEKMNLKNLFGIKNIISDAQMRRVLDQVNPKHIDALFSKRIRQLNHLGIRNKFRFLKKYYLCSVDGVRYFESRKIHCDGCSKIVHKSGETEYHHAMLGAVLVHPQQREVFPLSSEAIQRQDGKKKNDCELQASKRLQNKLLKHYRRMPLVIIEDALYANEPHIQQLLNHRRQFIIGVKPTKHKALFKHLEGRDERGLASSLVLKQGKISHHFKWINDTPLNGQGNIRVNFLSYEEHSPKGIRRFSWVTSLKLKKSNVEEIMRGGRARWKIENETFNTLKNQGYHFEHNYGHGKKYLCDILAKIMLLAFLIDQMVQANDSLFKKVWIAAKAKKRLWERLRALYLTQDIPSFKELFYKMASIFKVQLE